MFKAILKSDAETVLADYRKRRLSFPMSKDQSPESLLFSIQ